MWASGAHSTAAIPKHRAQLSHHQPITRLDTRGSCCDWLSSVLAVLRCALCAKGRTCWKRRSGSDTADKKTIAQRIRKYIGCSPSLTWPILCARSVDQRRIHERTRQFKRLAASEKNVLKFIICNARIGICFACFAKHSRSVLMKTVRNRFSRKHDTKKIEFSPLCFKMKLSRILWSSGAFLWLSVSPMLGFQKKNKTKQNRAVVQLCNHRTAHMCSHHGRNRFSPYK